MKRPWWHFQKGSWPLGVPGLSLGQNATDGPPEFGQGSHVRPVTGSTEETQDDQVSPATGVPAPGAGGRDPGQVPGLQNLETTPTGLLQRHVLKQADVLS